MRSEIKKNILCAALLFAAALVFMWNVLFTGKVLIPADILQFEAPWSAKAAPGADYHNTLISDAVVQSYPWRLHSMRTLRRGEVPLWNPYQFSGTPHAANSQSAVFYPVANLIFLIFGVAYGMGVNALVHLWLVGLGMFLLLRHLGAGRPGGVFAGFVLMFGGWFVSWLSRPEFIETAAWLPWLFLFFSLAVKRRSVVFAVVGGAVAGAQILGGHIQMAAYSWVALGMFAVYFATGSERSADRSLLKEIFLAAGYFALMLFIGVCVAAVQLGLTAELFIHAPRMLEAAGAEYVKSFRAGLAPFINILLPDYFGNPVLKNVRGGYNYSEMCAYCGILPLFLAVFAAFFRRKKIVFFFLALACISLLIAAGTPVYGLLLKIVPLFKVFAVSRFSLLFCFSVAALAGFGLDSLLKSGLLMRLTARFRWIAPAVAVLCFLLLIADLFPWGMKYNTACDPSLVYPRTDLVDRMKSDTSEPFRIHAFSTGHIMLLNSATVAGLEDARGYDSIFYRRYRELLRAFQEKRKPGSFVEGPWLSFTAFNPTLLKLLDVKYVMTPMPVDVNRPEFERIGLIDGVYLYKYRDYAPRAWLVDKCEKVADRGDIVPDAMMREDFDPRAEVLATDCSLREGGGPLRGARPWVKFTRTGAGKVEIEANVTKPSYLVISEVDYPGWNMELDGVRTKYDTADYVFRVVGLKPGRHRIVTKYVPKQALPCMLFGFAAIAVSLGFAVFGLFAGGVKQIGGFVHGMP